MIHRYGIKLGRLWVQYPRIRPRNLSIGVYVEKQYWEMGKRHQVFHVYPLPALRILLDWTCAGPATDEDNMRTKLWIRLWWWSRGRAIAAMRDNFPDEYKDAQSAWVRGSNLGEPLDSPAWNTRGLKDDLALHDAADSLLGEHA